MKSEVTKTTIYENETWKLTKHFDGVYVIESQKKLELGEPKVYMSLSRDNFLELAEMLVDVFVKEEQ